MNNSGGACLARYVMKGAAYGIPLHGIHMSPSSSILGRFVVIVPVLKCQWHASHWIALSRTHIRVRPGVNLVGSDAVNPVDVKPTDRRAEDKVVALVNPARQIDREYFLDLYNISVGANVNFIGGKYPQSLVPDILELRPGASSSYPHGAPSIGQLP